MLSSYIVMFIILIFFIILFFINFKNYNKKIQKQIIDDINEIKKPEIYEKIIKKNEERINIQGEINIENIIKFIDELKFNINDKKKEIENNDYKNKNDKLEKDIEILLIKNDNISKKIEEIKKEIKVLLNVN